MPHNQLVSLSPFPILPVVDDHDVGAGDTGHAVHLLRGERRQDEDAGLVVANAALVLHLKNKGGGMLAVPSNRVRFASSWTHSTCI